MREVLPTLVWQGEAREPFIIFVKTLSESGFIFDQANTWPAFLRLPGQTCGPGPRERQAQACERAPASGRGGSVPTGQTLTCCAFLNHAHENWLIRYANRVMICTLETSAQGLPGHQRSLRFCGIARGTPDNPTSILSTPLSLGDHGLFCPDSKNTTNAISFSDFSYLSTLGDTLGYRSGRTGKKKRYAATSITTCISLNVRLDLGKKQAISFMALPNARLPSVNTGKFFYNDSISSMNSFLDLNENNTFKENLVSSNGWSCMRSQRNHFGRRTRAVECRYHDKGHARYRQDLCAILNGGTISRSLDNFGDTLTDYSLAAGNVSNMGIPSNFDYTGIKIRTPTRTWKDFVRACPGRCGDGLSAIRVPGETTVCQDLWRSG